MSLKISKCSLSALQVPYLGVKVGAEGIEVDNSKIVAVQEARAPNTKTSLNRFVGMSGFYRKFINNYAKIAAPLALYYKDDFAEPFDLDESEKEAH